MRCFKLPLAILAVVASLTFSARANLPGGGTNGANVTLTDGGTTVTLANGIISIVITKADASIHTINYTFNNTGSSQTVNVLASGYSGGKLYWENSSDLGPEYTYAIVANPASNGGNYAEVVLTAADGNNVSNIVMEVHFSLLRGNSGFYAAPIWIHRSTDAAFSMGECRVNIYSGSIFNWMTVDTQRHKLMPVYDGTAIGVDSGPVECSLWTNGIYAGQYEDKYKYTADYGVMRTWGWSSVGVGGKNVGLWNVPATSEYMASGPMRRELTSHMGRTILNTPHGGHYGFCTDSDWAAGEVWSKVCGPYFFYCNNVTNTLTGTNTAAAALYTDALAQADAETGAWPYTWFTNSSYASAAQRGTITGRMVIADSFNPNASASNLWVGVEVQPANSAYDFQKWYKPYQFWTHTDASGNFTIPNVIATNGYTLYAFGPGAAGTFQSQNLTGGNPPNELHVPASPFSVTVTAGATNNLGDVTWTPTRVGPTVFEIGYPDRTAAKFRHGEDWWVGDIGPSATAPSPVWTKFLEFPFDFPSGPNYVVGQSRWATDWNFIQPVTINNTGNYDPWGNNSPSSSTITFTLSSVPASNGSLYIATASSYQGPMIVRVNGSDIAGAVGYDPAYDSSGSGSDASIREGIHGLFADTRLNVPTNYLHAGANTIYLQMRKSGYLANHTMYDYLRLELPGYVPPAPTTVKAYAGNNVNLISWPVQPGATTYNILRSTTAGSGYVSITNGVVGPVCGSGFNNATYLDTTAANSTAYYYVVRAVNPVGSSTNSPEASATPSAGIAASAPATPTGVSIGSVGHQSVVVNWTPAANANFYTVTRSTLYNNGGGASNILGTIVLANNVTNATYTDTSPTDGTIYRYAVAATGAGGSSTNSTGAVAVPKPTAPATPPMSEFITSVITTNITATATNIQQDATLTWNAVSGAVGYAIYRATSAAGPFVFLQSVSTTKYFNGGLATNQIYYYRVVALNASGVSANATDSINPKQAAPTSLTAVGSSTLPQIVLTWPTTPGATSYTIKRGTSIANETATVATGYTGTSYTNTGLVNGTTYFYIVTASGANGASGNSPEASATPGSSVWISIANGSWSGTTNWSNGQLASGSGAIADFTTLSLSSNVAVTLDSARTVSTLKFKDNAAAFNWSVIGTNTLTLAGAATVNVANQTATISTPVAGTAGLTKTGAGTLTLGGATNTFTGGVTNNSGSIGLDFSVAGSPTSDLAPAANALILGGATVQITGSSGVASAQTFNGVTLNKGYSVIAAAPVSGANLLVVTLGALTENIGGTVMFTGPATTNSTANVAATATITTTTTASTAGILGGLGLGKNGAYATVGLYDWATTNNGASPFTIVGGSQVVGFYQTNGVTTGGNYDVQSGGVNSIGNAGGANTLRYNQPAALTINNTAFTFQNCQGILITPRCGANNQTLSGNSLDFVRSTSSGQSYGVIWQNNPLGYFNCSIPLNNGRQANQNNGLVQAGPGTVVYNANNSYELATYLNGGCSLITSYASFGQTNNGYTTVSPVNLNGGTVVGNATFTHDQSGVNARQFILGNNGGGLAATAGNTMTVDGFVTDAAGAGALTIGIAASAANNFTANLLPGSGTGTANPTPVLATGMVALTAPNSHTGGTVLQGGTLNINGIFALGGANYGGLTFNGGTLQYAANFPGTNGSSDLTSIGNAGITFAAGTDTIDLNGNAVTYAGSIGNGGSGALVVKSSLANGSLNLQGANTYFGNTTVTNATLAANNASGSATGFGNVLVQNSGVLTGAGGVDGSVTVASGGALAPGAFNAFDLGGDLTLAAGSTTTLAVQRSPATSATVNVTGLVTEGGALVVTNVGATNFTAGDHFQLFSATSFAGAFASTNLPTLPDASVRWSTTRLNTDGSLWVVSTAPVSSPQIALVTNNLVFSANSGTPGWDYYLITTTNLALPTAAWERAVTNQFDGAGNLNLSLPLDPASPRRFYRLLVP